MARSRSRSRGRADDDVAGEVRPFRKGKKKGVGSPRTKKIPTLTYKVVSQVKFEYCNHDGGHVRRVRR